MVTADTKNNIQKVINNWTEYLIYGWGGEWIRIFDVPAVWANISEQVDILTNDELLCIDKIIIEQKIGILTL